MIPPSSVLIVVTRRIGDVLLATPVIHSIKRAWPDTRVHVLVFQGTEGVITAHPDVEKVLTIPERPGFFQHVVFIDRIFRRYELALSLVPGDRPTLYAWLAGKKSAGLLLPDEKHKWKRRLLDMWVAYDRNSKHMVHTHLALLAPLGIAPSADIGIHWDSRDERAVQALLAPLGGTRYVVLHPHPKFHYKMWRDEGWLELSRWLHKQHLRIVLTGSNLPEEMDYIKTLAARMAGEPLNLAGKMTLAQSACVISGAAAYVGPDTALTHMAAASGVPMVALFGPTDPVKWGPWPKDFKSAGNPWQRLGSQRIGNVTLLQGNTACVPCGHEGCQRNVLSFSDCLQSLPAEKVIAALHEQMRDKTASKKYQ